MHKRTKALAISQAVKAEVFARDCGCCILCGKRGLPNAHYIGRAQGGLGRAENIVTLCPECHRAYDQSTQRAALGQQIEQYLAEQYPGWVKEDLIYRK